MAPLLWRLDCLDGSSPCELQPEEGAQRLRIGRSVQAAELWERLLPDEGARNTVSREHFEVQEVGTRLELRNFSGRGTVVNGAAVLGGVELHSGDIIAVGLLVSEYGSRPALHFRLELEGCSPSGGRLPCIDEGVAAQVDLAMCPSLSASHCLEWVASAGRPPSDVAAHPMILPLRPNGAKAAVLRVGRAVQPSSVWDLVAQDAALRTAISREHFEVRTGEGLAGNQRQTVNTLHNLSCAGTLLNGRLVQDHRTLDLGDVIGVPRPREAGDGDPIVQFRFVPEAKGLALPVQPIATAASKEAAYGQILGAPAPARPSSLLLGREGQAARLVVSGDPQPPFAVKEQEQPPVVQIRVAGEAPVPQKPVAAEESTAVVKISMLDLPPPFLLECTRTHGLSAEHTAALPRQQRVLEATCSRACLKVGRSVQPPDFWATLLPDEVLRNSVSREHFEIVLEEDGLLLTNFSAAGTLVNTKCISERVRVLHGDRIGVGSSPVDRVPVVWFLLNVAGLNAAQEGDLPGAFPEWEE